MNTGTADKPEFQPPPPLDKSTRERDDVSLPRLNERRRRVKFRLTADQPSEESLQFQEEQLQP